MLRSLLGFLTLLTLWFALSATFNTLFITLGIAAAALATLFVAQTQTFTPRNISPIRPQLLPYLLWLLPQILRASLHITKTILSTKPRIKPQFQLIPLPHKTEPGRAIFANSITLTPGTITIQTQDNTLLLHALTAQAARPQKPTQHQPTSPSTGNT